MVSCTSGDKSSSVDDIMDETAAVDRELEGLDGDSFVGNDSFLDDQLPEDMLGETSGSAVADSGGSDDFSFDEAPPAPEIAADDSFSTGGTDSSIPDGFSAPPPVDDTSSGFADSGSGFSDSGSSTGFVDTGSEPSSDFGSSDSGFASNDSVPFESTPAPVVSAPLRKVEAAPIRRGGQLLNAVYISRPGDSFRSISSLVYGTDSREADLKAANAWVTTLRPGTKIYYNSPVRPTDEQQMLTYYEDQGIAPEVYQAQAGENIRTVSKNLLGYDRAWMEVWSTNNVESKGDLTEPASLRYWKGVPAGSVPAPTLASNNLPPKTEDFPPPQAAISEPPPPMDFPPLEDPMSDFPPPDAGGMGSVAANDFPPPPDIPPPPPMDLPPPPAINPPPPPSVAKKADSDDSAGAMDQDLVMIGGAGLVLLMLVGLIVARKRRQQKELASAFNDTQVGT